MLRFRLIGVNYRCPGTRLPRLPTILYDEGVQRSLTGSETRRGWPKCSSKRHPSTPGKIRTSDLRFRKPLLYPAELRGRV